MKKRIMTAILAVTMITTIALTGCSNDKTASPDTATIDTATSDTATVDETTKSVITDTGLTVDKDGNVVNADGKKVEVSADGKVEVKTSDGKTVKVNANDIKTVNDNNSSSTSKSNNTSTDKASSSTSSKTNNSSSSTSSKNNSSSSNSSSSSKTDSGNSSSDNKTYHEAVYKEVKHDAVYEDKWVVTQKAYSYEKPVYEQQERAICSGCGADITDLGQSGISAHMKEHALKGENGAWHSEWIDVQTGTETVTVPEEGRYESIKVKDAWTEKVLVKKAGWY